MGLIIEPPSIATLGVERAAHLRYGAADARHPWPQGGGPCAPHSPGTAAAPADGCGTPAPRPLRAPRAPIRPAGARRDRADRDARPHRLRRRLGPADRSRAARERLA